MGQQMGPKPPLSRISLMSIERAGVRLAGRRREIASSLSTPERALFRPPPVPFCPLPGPSLGRGLPSLCGPGLRLGPSSGCLRSPPLAGRLPARERPERPPSGAFGPVRLRSFAPPILRNGPPSFQPSDKRHAPKCCLLPRAWNPGTSLNVSYS